LAWRKSVVGNNVLAGATKRKLLSFLIEAQSCNKSLAGYGAPGKGNTLLNYCGIRVDFLDYTVDRNPYKHGKYLPGTHIPIFPPEIPPDGRESLRPIFYSSRASTWHKPLVLFGVGSARVRKV
jgi:hypothetical protein